MLLLQVKTPLEGLPGIFPGQHVIGMETTILQVLSKAGGFKKFASPDDIMIIRKTNGSDTQIINFDYEEVDSDNIAGQDILLKRGDVIVVP